MLKQNIILLVLAIMAPAANALAIYYKAANLTNTLAERAPIARRAPDLESEVLNHASAADVDDVAAATTTGTSMMSDASPTPSPAGPHLVQRYAYGCNYTLYKRSPRAPLKSRGFGYYYYNYYNFTLPRRDTDSSTKVSLRSTNETYYKREDSSINVADAQQRRNTGSRFF
ncbi:hypothetical protein Dda_7244 [Drechslerella dactyloides]|uniref:Uncharacterized protein n=1 Tax=Drechslerella dactyloides TaxID=74499 RepID=A0AAD6IRX9_DREDA|nr:hypothetical protein Dda_7244 [Drechslerella dactyloides]